MKLKLIIGLLCILAITAVPFLIGHSVEDTHGFTPETTVTDTTDVVALQEVDLMDGAITITMPEDFASADEALVAMEYPEEYIPAEIYTNAEGTINFAMKHDDMPLAVDEVENYINEMSSLLGVSESLVLLSSGVNEIDGQDIGYLNIVTEQEGKQVYNSVWVTSLDGTALFASVNCNDDIAVEVKPIAEDMYKSIKFNN